MLSILTRPLHGQRAVGTEGVDQAGCNKARDRWFKLPSSTDNTLFSIYGCLSEAEVTITFCDVPGNAPKEDLAGVQRILVVPGRQLTTPGEGGFIHS